MIFLILFVIAGMLFLVAIELEGVKEAIQDLKGEIKDGTSARSNKTKS